MKAYRYNAKNRNDRTFNNCGIEKNPNAVKFYAANLEYADKYKFIRFEDGDINYECELETTDISANLFDMADNFRQLNTYKSFINEQISRQLSDYTTFMNNAKKASERKMWKAQIAELKHREIELSENLIVSEFQALSDFNLQNSLISELKSMGFDGYKTINEIAIF